MSLVLTVSATFTADPIEPVLSFWMRELGWEPAVRFAPYDQVVQQLLDPNSLLACNRGGVNVVLVRLEDWLRHRAGAPVDPYALETRTAQFVGALRHAAESFPSPLLVAICPASPPFLEDPERAGLEERLVRYAAQATAGLGAVCFVPKEEIDSLYPVPAVHDPHGDELGHIPYTPEYFAALGTTLARKAHALRRPPYKAIALDCDDTLWQGVCGEAGPAGVVLDSPRRELQEFMLAQREAGMLLCLCSKNNEADVFETFRAHPEMPLRLEHFTARRINWESKAGNLMALADELELGLDSLLFVDDNPKECAEVAAACPEVAAIPLPAEASEIPRFLRHVWAFDHVRVTAEDRKRASLYTQQAERKRLEKAALSLAGFIQSLGLEIGIQPAVPDEIPRIAQLTQRTNQFNCTTIRRTEAELGDLLKRGAECLAVTVRDRFGEYGLTGAAIFRAAGDALIVDTLLVSCRVLGRGVEHRILARLGDLARERGLEAVEIPFSPTPRNQPARLFLDSTGPEYRETRGADTVYRYPAEGAARAEWKPGEAKPPAGGAAGREEAAPRAGGAPRTDYAAIARDLNPPARILAALRARRPGSSLERTGVTAPRTALEAELARLWADLLHVPAVGALDNFFDLGGHSLLAVQLLSGVRRQYGVDLSIELVYGGDFTVAELAKAIELRQIEGAGADGYATLLEEIESLSEEEVRALLAEEEGGQSGP